MSKRPLQGRQADAFLHDCHVERVVSPDGRPCVYNAGEIPVLALIGPVASGTLTVTFEGRSMTYRSVQELQRAIAIVQSSLNQQSDKRVRQYQLSGRKGI